MTMKSYLFRFHCPNCGSIFPPENEETIATYPENYQNDIRNDIELMNRYKQIMPPVAQVLDGCEKTLKSTKDTSTFANVMGIHTHTRYLYPECAQKYVEDHPKDFSFLKSVFAFLDENESRLESIFGVFCKELSRICRQYAVEYEHSQDENIIIDRLQKANLANRDSAIKAHRKDLRKSVRANIAYELENYVPLMEILMQ